MKILFFISTLLLFVFTSCTNATKKGPEAATDIAPADTKTAESGDYTASYEGSINNKYEISMQLTRTGDVITGTYSYKSKGKAITLNGTIAPDGKVELAEMSKGALTGIFTGQLTDTVFSGQWTKPDHSGSMPFSMKQTGIASMKTKADVLSNAIGEYSLRSVSGIAGANTMFDTYMENGKWRSESSANIGGQREGSAIDLDKKDLDLLNNMRIVVDDQRNIHFYAGLVELFNSPFKAQGMDYRVKQSDKTKMNEKIASLSPDTIKVENKYILLADDSMSYTKLLNGNFDLVAEDNMILTYIPGTSTFELEIFAGGCCDSNILTFVKQ